MMLNNHRKIASGLIPMAPAILGMLFRWNFGMWSSPYFRSAGQPVRNDRKSAFSNSCTSTRGYMNGPEYSKSRIVTTAAGFLSWSRSPGGYTSARFSVFWLRTW